MIQSACSDVKAQYLLFKLRWAAGVALQFERVRILKRVSVRIVVSSISCRAYWNGGSVMLCVGCRRNPKWSPAVPSKGRSAANALPRSPPRLRTTGNTYPHQCDLKANNAIDATLRIKP